MLLRGVRVHRRAMRGMMAGVVSRLLRAARSRDCAEIRVRELRRRGRMHGTDAHDRWFADAQDEPDREECAQHANHENGRHSVRNYSG